MDQTTRLEPNRAEPRQSEPDGLDTASAPPVARAGGPRRRDANFYSLLGLAGLTITIVAVVLGLRLVDRVGTTIAGSLELTAEGVATVEDTVAAAADTVDVAGRGLATLTEAVAGTERSLEGIRVLVDGAAGPLGSDVPDSLDAIGETMPALIRSAELVESALDALSFVGVDFAPPVPPAESLRTVDAQLDDIATALREAAGRLDGIAGDTAAVTTDVGALVAELGALSAQLERADVLLDGYAGTASRVASLVEATSDELHAQRREGRFLVLLLGAVLGLLQLVPLTLGRRLRDESIAATFGPTAAG